MRDADSASHAWFWFFMALLFAAFAILGCAPVKPKPNNWQKCCVLRTVCISDGRGGPNCDAPEQQP